MKWIVIPVLVLAGMLILVIIIGALLPKQHVASRSASLNASPEATWSLISGPPTWWPEIKSYEELAPQNGHQMRRETDRHGQIITYEIIESAPPKRLVSKIADPKLPFGGTWTYDIEPTERGCSLTITENGEVYNPVFRFVSRFVMGHTATIDSYLKALQTKLVSTMAAGA